MSFQIYETIGSIMKYDVIDENSSNLPKKKKVVIKFNYLTQSQIITLKHTHTHTHTNRKENTLTFSPTLSMKIPRSKGIRRKLWWPFPPITVHPQNVTARGSVSYGRGTSSWFVARSLIMERHGLRFNGWLMNARRSSSNLLPRSK